MKIAGLDLGKVRDPTALVVADRKAPGGVYRLERIDEWTPREDDLGDVIPIVNACGAEAVAFDAGGKPGGKPAKKFAERLARVAVMPVYPIVVRHLTYEAQPKYQKAEHGWEIKESKAELVRVYIDVITARRLCYPETLPLAWKLSEQIRLYRESRDPVYGHTSWSAPPGEHDDILSAVQLMLWLGERGDRFKPANSKGAE